MAGPLTEVLVEKLAESYPDACIEVLLDIEQGLSNMEQEFGVVPTRTLKISRDYMRRDAERHATDHGKLIYEYHGGRVGG